MRIVIMNPNSNTEMTQLIQRTGERFSAGQYQVICRATPEAPAFIETYEDQLTAAPAMIRLVRENEATCDGFIVACHSDPNLDVLKEVTRRPVVGIGEASLRLAAMLGHRFSVIVTSAHSVPAKQELVRKYGLEAALASIRAVDPGKGNEEERYLAAARSAVEKDGAEVIVLGCAGLCGLDRRLEERLGVPVLDGVICALILVTGLARYGVAHSKLRRFNPHWS